MTPEGVDYGEINMADVPCFIASARTAHYCVFSRCRGNIHGTVLFLILVCEAIGTAATPGLFCQPRVIVKMIVEKQIECRLAGETEIFGENLPQRHFCPSQNPT
jgi:hypothetical protein